MHDLSLDFSLLRKDAFAPEINKIEEYVYIKSFSSKNVGCLTAITAFFLFVLLLINYMFILILKKNAYKSHKKS